MTGSLRGTPCALAVFIAIAVSLVAAFEPTKLSSWIPEQKASLKTYAYDEHNPQAAVCMKITAVDTCGIIGPGTGSYFETSMDCCAGNKRHPDMSEGFSTIASSVGKCAWRYELITTVDSYLSGISPLVDLYTEVTLVGRFSVQCDFKEGAKECGEACDDMILEANGPLYLIPNAALKAPIPQLSYPNVPVAPGVSACEALTFGFFFGEERNTRTDANATGPRFLDFSTVWSSKLQSTLGAKSKTTKATKKSDSSDKAQTTKAGEAAVAYVSGAALAISGPAWISSRHSNNKYDQGYLQAIVDIIPKLDEEGKTIPIVPFTNQYIADPYRLDISLREKQYKGEFNNRRQDEYRHREQYDNEGPRQYGADERFAHAGRYGPDRREGDRMHRRR